jgi:hypothetical protein
MADSRLAFACSMHDMESKWGKMGILNAKGRNSTTARIQQTIRRKDRQLQEGVSHQPRGPVQAIWNVNQEEFKEEKTQNLTVGSPVYDKVFKIVTSVEGIGNHQIVTSNGHTYSTRGGEMDRSLWPIAPTMAVGLIKAKQVPPETAASWMAFLLRRVITLKTVCDTCWKFAPAYMNPVREDGCRHCTGCVESKEEDGRSCTDEMNRKKYYRPSVPGWVKENYDDRDRLYRDADPASLAKVLCSQGGYVASEQVYPNKVSEEDMGMQKRTLVTTKMQEMGLRQRTLASTKVASMGMQVRVLKSTKSAVGAVLEMPLEELKRRLLECDTLKEHCQSVLEEAHAPTLQAFERGDGRSALQSFNTNLDQAVAAGGDGTALFLSPSLEYDATPDKEEKIWQKQEAVWEQRTNWSSLRQHISSLIELRYYQERNEDAQAKDETGEAVQTEENEEGGRVVGEHPEAAEVEEQVMEKGAAGLGDLESAKHIQTESYMEALLGAGLGDLESAKHIQTESYMEALLGAGLGDLESDDDDENVDILEPPAKRVKKAVSQAVNDLSYARKGL